MCRVPRTCHHHLLRISATIGDRPPMWVSFSRQNACPANSESLAGSDAANDCLCSKAFYGPNGEPMPHALMDSRLLPRSMPSAIIYPLRRLALPLCALLAL